jgi:hypothetical protein
MNDCTAAESMAMVEGSSGTTDANAVSKLDRCGGGGAVSESMAMPGVSKTGFKTRQIICHMQSARWSCCISSIGLSWNLYKALVDPQAKQHAVPPKPERSLQYKPFWASWTGVISVSTWLWNERALAAMVE